MKINNVTPVINNNSTKMNSEKVPFTGLVQSCKDGLTDLFTLDRKGPMSRKLFIVNAFAFLLGTRLVTSRGKDERREIIIRDIPTIVIAVIGVPVIQNLFAGLVQKKSGFAFLEEDADKDKFAKLVNKMFKQPNTKVASYSQLEDWYKFDAKNLASGFEGFTERLSKQGGNLKTIFSSLGKDIKGKLADFSGDNAEFIKKLSENGNKDLKQAIVDGFKSDKNKALKQASFLKTVPTLIGLGLTLSIIGIFIPKLNIFITEAVNKGKKTPAHAKTEEKKVNSEAPSSTSVLVDASPAVQSFSANGTKKVLENFAGNR